MLADLGLLIVRAVIGVLFVGHGLQKLGSLNRTGQFMESLGLRPGRRWALASGLAEFIGGVLFALGALNPLATVLICTVMLMAIARVHWSKGLWVQNGGFEYPLTVLATTIGVALAEPGAYSIDAYINATLPVVPVLVYGLIGALLVLAAAWARDQRLPWHRSRTT
jgi:putative oxidoreductase